jgi:alkylation response protein AidB-like acyl-CoA dehydrogenase
MDFGLSQKTQEMVQRTRRFVDEQVIPLEKLIGRPWNKEILPALEDARRKAKDAGLWTPQLQLPLEEFARISEELGRSPFGHYSVNAQAPDAGNLELLSFTGGEEQKARFWKPLSEGRIRSCFSMTEPDRPGSNPTWLDTRAELRDGQWVINGRKWFTTAADGAAFAIVMAVTDPEAPPHLRASMIIVPCDTPGFNLIRNIPVMGHAGEGWPTHAEIEYRDVKVPEENLLGGRGFGFALAQERLGPGRIHHTMRWIGICERAFELMCRRAATRELSPGKPLATRQAVQEWIADSRAEIDAARLLVLQAAWKMEREGQREARSEISAVKYFAAGVLQRVLDRAVQTHGALGVTDDTPLAFWYREERASRIYDGPDEVHKGVVARRALKKFGVEIK